MSYELWDVSIGRLLGAFAYEDEALQDVLVLLDHFGDKHAEHLVLVGVTDDENVTGADLAARARAATPIRAD